MIAARVIGEFRTWKCPKLDCQREHTMDVRECVCGKSWRGYEILTVVDLPVQRELLRLRVAVLVLAVALVCALSVAVYCWICWRSERAHNARAEVLRELQAPNFKFQTSDFKMRGGAAVARETHTLKVAGSIPAPATTCTPDAAVKGPALRQGWRGGATYEATRAVLNLTGGPEALPPWRCGFRTPRFSGLPTFSDAPRGANHSAGLASREAPTPARGTFYDGRLAGFLPRVLRHGGFLTAPADHLFAGAPAFPRRVGHSAPRTFLRSTGMFLSV